MSDANDVRRRVEDADTQINSTEELDSSSQAVVGSDEIMDLVGVKLRLAYEGIFKTFAQAVDDPKLKPRRFTALALISENPGISQTDLSALVGRDKSTITPMILDLIVSGYVRREHSESDRRIFRLFLTPLGSEKLGVLWACARTHEARIDAIIGLDRRREFMLHLDNLIAAFS